LQPQSECYPLGTGRAEIRRSTQSLIQLANQNQATIGSHSRSLEIDLQGSIERELKGLVLLLTHGVFTSEASSLRLDPHKHRWRRTLKGSLVEFKLEIWA